MGIIHPGPPEELIFRLKETYRIQFFVETGTYLGDTIAAVKGRTALRVFSMEIDKRLYEMACRRFAGNTNIELYYGDCTKVLPLILSGLREPAVFWLDAHYSGGITSRGVVDDPVLTSLRQLAEHPIRCSILMIDDARSFDGLDGHPHLQDVIHAVMRVNTHYVVRVHNDVVIADIP